MLRRSAPVAHMRLGAFAEAVNSASHEDGKSIDFTAAGLYLPGAQTIVATTTSACVSVLACWLVPLGAISAVRTLALTATAGVLIIRKPIKIGNTKGVNTIFSALRPCCLLYVSCLVLEQLVLVEPPRPAMIAKTSALVSTSEFIACITALLHDEPADEQ